MTATFIRPPRVLVVDDDEGIRGLIDATLSTMGCQVTCEADGRLGLARLDEGTWDAVLLDLNLPGMNGFKVLEAIRDRYPVEKLPVIMITGQDDSETRFEALRLRANDFLSKPLHPAELLARMNTVLSMRIAQQELEERVAELGRMNELKDLLVNYCIHDMRGPLSSARGFVELAMERAADPAAPEHRHLARALGAIDMVVRMASDVIEVTKMEEGRLTPALEDVDAGGIVRARVELFEGLASSRRVTLGVVVEEGLTPVRADVHLLERILDNLTTNALKHTPPGGRVTLRAARAPEGASVVLAVEDTGEGIPQAWLGRIFDKFTQVEARRLGFAHDTGLGLTFCRMAAEAQGARLWVESEEGRGSRFSLEVPLAAVRPEALDRRMAVAA
ncbi:MAG: hybrid sensor histidine kinase/response regulator [Candidatus Coatesbacteria bacterium]